MPLLLIAITSLVGESIKWSKCALSNQFQIIDVYRFEVNTSTETVIGSHEKPVRCVEYSPFTSNPLLRHLSFQYFRSESLSFQFVTHPSTPFH
jgi:hypothetical protein